MEERLSRLNEMARRVVAANPKEARQVQARQTEITALWDKLKVRTIVYIFQHIFSRVSTKTSQVGDMNYMLNLLLSYSVLFVCFFLSFF